MSIDLFCDFELLYNSVNEKAFDKEFYLKKFSTSNFGSTFIGFIAYDSNNTPAAYYGVYPLLIKNKEGQILKVAQSGDTMTHPLHRKKGLFEMLFFKTAELAKKENINFIFGFPNKNSLPGFLKFGWKNQFISKKYVVKIEIAFLTKMILKIGSNHLAKRQKKFLQKTTKVFFPESNLSTSLYYIPRSKEYIDYKNYSDSFIIQIEKMIIWAKQDGSNFLIGDIYSDNYEDISLSLIKKTLRKLGFKMITFFCSENHKLNTLFSKESYPTNDLPLITYSIKEEFANEKIEISYTFADFDTF